MEWLKEFHELWKWYSQEVQNILNSLIRQFDKYTKPNLLSSKLEISLPFGAKTENSPFTTKNKVMSARKKKLNVNEVLFW